MPTLQFSGYAERLLREVTHIQDVLAAAGYELKSFFPRVLKPSGITVTCWKTKDGLVRIEYRQSAPRGLKLKKGTPQLRVLFPSKEHKRRGLVLRGFNTEDEALYGPNKHVSLRRGPENDPLINELSEAYASWKELHLLSRKGWSKPADTSLMANAILDYMRWHRVKLHEAYEMQLLRQTIVGGIRAAGIPVASGSESRNYDYSSDDTLTIDDDRVTLMVRSGIRSRDRTWTGKGSLHVRFGVSPWNAFDLTLVSDRGTYRPSFIDQGERPAFDPKLKRAFLRSEAWKSFLRHPAAEHSDRREMRLEDIVPALVFFLRYYRREDKKNKKK